MNMYFLQHIIYANRHTYYGNFIIYSVIILTKKPFLTQITQFMRDI